MNARWINSRESEPAFHRDGSSIYPVDARHEYFEHDGWRYKVPAGEASRYVAGDWDYTADGKFSFCCEGREQSRPPRHRSPLLMPEFAILSE
jgi:hypothetical protein